MVAIVNNFGQILVVFNCNLSSLDQTIKFKTSYRAKPKLGQLQLILSLAQLSPSLFYFDVKLFIDLLNPFIIEDASVIQILG